MELHYFLRKYIFCVIFLFSIFAYSFINIYSNKDKLKAEIKECISLIEKEEVGSAINSFDEYAKSSLYKKMSFIEMYGFFQKLLYKNEINNFEYVKDKDGFLHFTEFYKGIENDYDKYARQVRRLAENAKNPNCKTIFVNPLGLYIENITRINDGYSPAKYDKEQDEFLFNLYENNVKVLDTRKTILEKNKNKEELFYKTDHHWTTQAEFYAFCDIVDYLNENFDANLDSDYYFRDINNYNLKLYKNSFIGSLARKAGIIYSGKDDYLFIEPKEQGKFSYFAHIKDNVEISRSGSFKDAFIVEKFLKDPDTYTEAKHMAYIGEISPYEVLKNEGNSSGPKVLFIRDSYLSASMCFLANLCSEIHSIWPLSENLNFDIEEFVEENDFDYIIVEAYPGNFNEEFFSFYKEAK